MTNDLFPLLTDELARKVEAAIRDVIKTPGGGGEAFAMIFRRHGVGVVDRDRLRCTVDEVVYEGALLRGRRWQRLALGYLAPTLPGAAVWRDVSRGIA